MNQRRADTATAAPPDDAGHQGSFTRPEDVLEMHAADQPPQAPALHENSARYANAGDGVNPVWLLVGALALVAITAFFVLVRL